MDGESGVGCIKITYTLRIGAKCVGKLGNYTMGSVLAAGAPVATFIISRTETSAEKYRESMWYSSADVVIGG